MTTGRWRASARRPRCSTCGSATTSTCSMACGLGGTSLINANVCLSPDPRVFEDGAWPLEVRARPAARRRLRARARTCCAPSRRRARPSSRRWRRCAWPRRPSGARWRRFRCTSSYTSGHQRRRRAPGRLHRVRRLLRRLQRRRQDDGRLDLPRRRRGVRRRDLHRHACAVAGQGGDGGWRVWVRPAHGERRTAGRDLAHGRHRRAGCRHARARPRSCCARSGEGLALSDWLGSRFTSNGDVIALAYNNDVPVNGVGVGEPPKAQVPPVGPGGQRAHRPARRPRPCATASPSCECALPSAFAARAAGAAGAGRRASSASTSARSLDDQLDAMGRATDSLHQGRLPGRRAQHADLPRRRPRRRQRADAARERPPRHRVDATARSSASSSASRRPSRRRRRRRAAPTCATRRPSASSAATS